MKHEEQRKQANDMAIAAVHDAQCFLMIAQMPEDKDGRTPMRFFAVDTTVADMLILYHELEGKITEHLANNMDDVIQLFR